ncbi:MAG: autotransporter outer membrane beta-barrel domain-containing protein [Maricaulaceae bacterium]
MSSKYLLKSVAGTVLLMGLANLSTAQTSVQGETEAPLTTSDSGDITIEAPDTTNDIAAGVVTGTNGNLVTLDSNNNITNNGTISTEDSDDVVGVLITGGVTGNYTQTGTITHVEDFIPEDTDDSTTIDGPFAIGNNRTGILISGASPFTGNVDIQSGQIAIEGNNSSAIRLASDTTISGNIINNGGLALVGNNTIGLDIEGDVLGQLANSGTITTQGEGSQGIRVQGDITGSFSNSGSVGNSGLRAVGRPTLIARGLLDEEDTLQAGSAIEINGNVTQGVLFGTSTLTTTDEDGVETTTIASTSSVVQSGAAAAVLIDGQGTPISLGLVTQITDPDDPNFDPDLQFGFVQLGSITAQGVIDDSPATAIELANVEIENGLFNRGAISVSTFRSGDDGTDDAAGFDGHARGIVLREGVTIEDFVNEGAILVTALEATDEVFQDRDAIIPARLIQATAIDISADSVLESILNDGIITASATARDGVATTIVDRSGTLTNIVNRGQINANSVNSDPSEDEISEITTVALDLSANTSGVTILQGLDPTPVTLLVPTINGDILLGSGDDTVTSSFGALNGDIAFGAGADVLNLNSTNFEGRLSDSDGVLAVTVENGSLLRQTETQTIDVTNATFDGTSSFETVIDGVSGDAGTLVATNNVTLEDGAQVGLALTNVLQLDNQTFDIISADNLDIQGAVDQLDSSVSPFLYDVTYGLAEGDPNTLVVTLDLRSTEDLGLDTRQAASFTSAFEALASNAALGQAFTAITEEAEFNQAFNQILPEVSASPLYFIQANVDGAVGAVGTHLENARRSQDRSGGAWLQQFTYFADRELDGLSEQFRGFGFGFAGGLDTSWGPFHTVGANLAFASTQVEDVLGVDDPLNIVTYQVGTYAGAEHSNFSLDLYAGAGVSDIENNRFVRFGDFTGSSRGEWNATHINGSARLGYNADIGDRFWVRPSVSLDYLRLDEESFRETGDVGLALGVESRVSDRAGATALLNVGTTFNGNRTWLKPSLRAGYRTDFISDPVLTQFQFIDLVDSSGNLFDGQIAETLSGEVSDSGFILGFSVAAGSKWSSFSFDFDSDIRDGFIRHTGRVVVRLLF